MTVFDEIIILKDAEGLTSVEATVEKLNEMLNAYDIPHAFMLPSSTMIETNPTAVLALCYESERGLEVDLSYTFFSKRYRGTRTKKAAAAGIVKLHLSTSTKPPRNSGSRGRKRK